MKTLRRRLFASHLTVMLVAVGVIVVGSGFVFALAWLVGGGFDRDSDGKDNGPPPPVFLLLPVAGAVAASGAVSWRVARRIAEPLEEIGDATRRIAEGDYQVRTSGGDTVELAALADDVNALAVELDDIEARRRRLIGDVAHELRNPLATIQASMEALMDGVAPATIETYAGVGQEAARLRRLADDLTELSVTGEYLVPHDETAVDLGSVVRRVVSSLASQAEAKSIDLTTSVGSDEPIVVTGDEDRIVQVVNNVVGNAIQYSEDGTVTAVVRHEAGVAIVTVTDQGRGLAPDDVLRVFERFYRVDGHLTEGTGVGLPIARAIVRAHGGTIVATSAGPGQGSTFTISLPERDATT